MIKRLETERLILRNFVEADAVDVYAYAKNPNVGPAAGWPPHSNEEESGRIVRMFMQAGDVWAIVCKETGHVIGSMGLHRDSKRDIEKARMLGYVLAEPYWGKGLMTEAVQEIYRYAFEELKFEIISAYHFPFNERSKKVILKSGMQYEGTLRRAIRLFNDDVEDELCYSITCDEYFCRKG